MPTRRYLRLIRPLRHGAAIALGVILPIRIAGADVTVQQQTSLDAAGIRIDITETEQTAADRQRRDATTHCGGLLSLFCRHASSADIVRLDKQLDWHLDPSNQTYVETDFPTPEQRRLAEQQMQAALEQMKQCEQQRQGAASKSGPDTSHCELSAPNVTVTQTDDRQVIAGHEARRTRVMLSQTCTDHSTGDVCELDYGFDSWLTGDDIPGSQELQTFRRNYLAAQGLDPNDLQTRGIMQQFMSRYADTFKQLSAQAGSLKGYPLRTTFSLSYGGEHCSRVAHASAGTASAPAQDSDHSAAHGFGLGSLAADAVSSRLGGWLSRHGADAKTSADTAQAGGNAAATATDAATAPAAGSAPGTPGAAAPGSASSLVQVISMTTEVKSIDTTAIPAAAFEIPAGWKQQPRPQAGPQKAFTCPVTGN